METIIRHWNILQLIPRSPRKITPRGILDELSARGLSQPTLRTIQRDLNFLSVPFQLVNDGYKPAGWSWSKEAPDYDLPAMDPRTALTYEMVQKFISQMLPGVCVEYLAPNFKRAHTILDNLQTSGLGTWPEKVGVVARSQPLLPPIIAADILGTVYDALLANKKIMVSYQNRYSSEPKDAEIHPLGIVWADHVVYLVCTFWNYAGLRHIPVHRIKSANLLDESCSIPENFDLQSYINSGAFGYTTESQTIKLRAYFAEHAAYHLQETPLSKDQQLTPQDNGDVLIEASVLKTSQLIWWLLGFGDNIEVLDPPDLRNEIVEIVEGLADIYRINT